MSDASVTPEASGETPCLWRQREQVLRPTGDYSGRDPDNCQRGEIGG